eukprot:CAMPEP_0194373902 /NCGR_PEP_ID=MMETSP0174-20130528/22295_1 /TAXON_ID=216777 /ORGANISM="Proboscia alata, Strain PI-D3" /LENGTH=351 /DNA_ID=CAMNT_0039153185 /DNA_START=220 /DNA_END=1275 /DNA_ORIENTATION=+
MVDRKWHEHAVRSSMTLNTFSLRDLIWSNSCSPLPSMLGIECSDGHFRDESILRMQLGVKSVSPSVDSGIVTRVSNSSLGGVFASFFPIYPASNSSVFSSHIKCNDGDVETCAPQDDETSYKSNRSCFVILGTQPRDEYAYSHTLSRTRLESLRFFLPSSVSESNFWLKYSCARDGASLQNLFSCIHGSNQVIIAIETNEGEVFGSFTSSAWRVGPNYYGSGESFLWRLKHSDIACLRFSDDEKQSFEPEVEVFPWTNNDDYIQLCTSNKLVVGGGEWSLENAPYQKKDVGLGLTLDSDLLFGTSSSCSTFGNCALSRYGFSFEIAAVEVWAFTPCFNVDDAKKLESLKHN